MKHYILGILLTAAFAFAQDASTDSASSSTGSATVKEPVEQATPEETAVTQEQVEPVAQELSEPAEQAAPERTPEGYRIIRITAPETKVYKDSVAEVKKAEEEAKRETVPFKFSLGPMATLGYRSISGISDLNYYSVDSVFTMFSGLSSQIGIALLIPLSEYNFAIRTGVLFGYTSLIAHDYTQYYRSTLYENDDWSDASLTQMRVSIPLLLAMKTRVSTAMFELGAQVSFPIVDEMSNYGKKTDLIDEGFRASVDVSLLFGIEIFVTKRLSISALLEIQLNDTYNNDIFIGVNDVSYFDIKVGATYAVF